MLRQLDLAFRDKYMAGNKIIGRAKKFDGTAIDYVSIFNWDDGKCIAQVEPDLSGMWEYQYSKDLSVGFTYVANGCQPVTHGAYQFTYQPSVPTDYILAYSFDGNVLDKAANALHGVTSGALNFVSGRKADTQALSFNGGLVKTPKILPVGTNKLTLSFHVKSTQTNIGMIAELSENANIYNAFYAYVGGGGTRIDAFMNDMRNNKKSQVYANGVTDGLWHHIVIEFDRSAVGASNHSKVYIDNVLSSVAGASQQAITGIFSDKILHIGSRKDSSLPFSGALQDVYIYSRILTADERTALFNE